jgi:protein-L-isoaspartate(D-aspartate) O-methyltransferase
MDVDETKHRGVSNEKLNTGQDILEQRRHRMVDLQIADRGVRDTLVLSAMHKVEREKFIPADLLELAYRDGALPIGCGQTISQPYIVAMMTEALELKGGERVLEIGTGSAYAAAVLAEIAGQVISIECVKELADRARETLAELNYDNVTVIEGDGTKGYEASAPYDGIVVTAGGPDVPKSLRKQLKIGGRLVIPVGASQTMQTLIRVTRNSDEQFSEEDLCGVRFVPLVGEEGWHQN